MNTEMISSRQSNNHGDFNRAPAYQPSPATPTSSDSEIDSAKQEMLPFNSKDFGNRSNMVSDPDDYDIKSQ